VAPSNHLLRELAPITPRSWDVIAEEARQRLTPLLAGRRLADWSGPHDWDHDRLKIGRTTELDGPPPGTVEAVVEARQRRVLPLVEVKVPFTIARRELDDLGRGAKDPDLGDLDRAARHAAVVENRAILHGWAEAGLSGMTQSSSFDPVELGDDCLAYPSIVAMAVNRMRSVGIEGPYALAISPPRYTSIIETTEHGGYLLIDHLRRVLDGPVVWAPGIDSAVLTSQRGGDFLLDVGQDWAIGYTAHDATTVSLYLEESFMFLATEPDAAAALT
jgi:uncharacterized linocin/CFP29 family protein